MFSISQLMCFSSQRERKLLQNKRLDLDAAKNRLKKARVADARSAVSITHTQYLMLSYFSS